MVNGRRTDPRSWQRNGHITGDFHQDRGYFTDSTGEERVERRWVTLVDGDVLEISDGAFVYGQHSHGAVRLAAFVGG